MRRSRTTDVIMLWGSNAREAHPIFFHHAARRASTTGRRCISRRPPTYLSRPSSPICGSGSTSGPILRSPTRSGDTSSPRPRQRRLHCTLDAGHRCVPRLSSKPGHWRARAESHRRPRSTPSAELAEAYATAESAQICWTLGITEHHNAVDNVLALCNLALLTGHVGRWGSGLVPASWTEQRARWRRHGSPSEQAPRIPGHRG